MSDLPAEVKAQLDSPEVWVDEYGDFLYRYTLSRVKDPSTAEDLVQETFLRSHPNSVFVVEHCPG